MAATGHVERVTLMFAVGDVVQLKSGGPSMTVFEVENGHVITTWFDSASNKQSGGYPFAAVRKVEDVSGGPPRAPKFGTMA